MINRTEIKLPYPTRVGFFVKKKVGFSFDNLAIFLLHESIEVDTQEDFKKWLKNNSENRLYIETLWNAAKAYNMHNAKKFKLKKEKFVKGLAMLDEQTAKHLMNAWKNAESFGAKKPYNAKKKVIKK
jgi:nitrogen regulatory protein PII-like uncharacterized protein